MSMRTEKKTKTSFEPLQQVAVFKLLSTSKLMAKINGLQKLQNLTATVRQIWSEAVFSKPCELHFPFPEGRAYRQELKSSIQAGLPNKAAELATQPAGKHTHRTYKSITWTKKGK